MLFCYSIASHFCSSFHLGNLFGLVCLLICLFLSFFHFHSPHVLVAYYSFRLRFLLVFFSLLSIESLNQFQFNHTYSSTFTVQAITYFLVVFVFPHLFTLVVYVCVLRFVQFLFYLFSAHRMCDSFLMRRGSFGYGRQKCRFLPAIRECGQNHDFGSHMLRG